MIRKYWKYLRFLVIPAGLLLLTVILYKLTDALSMGVLAEWLDRWFSIEYTSVDADGTEHIIRSVSWENVKLFFFEATLTLILLFSWLGIVIFDITRQRIRRKHSHEIAADLQRFLLADEAVPLEIPQEDAEVFSKIAEVRLEMAKRSSMLKEESQRKNDLITYLAHDLKTPLTSVIGYLTLLRDAPDMPVRERAKYTGIAVKKAERLEELMAEMFEITRFNLTQIELQPEQVNFSMMLEQIVSEFEPLLQEKQLFIKADISPDIECCCDLDKTERIIDNLIRNAISYSFPSSEIHISCNSQEDNVVLVVSNRGRTIPAEKLERIFEPFYRMDSSRSSTTGGSGLGLAIAKQLIEVQGGTIQAESQMDTISFTVKIPCKKIV